MQRIAAARRAPFLIVAAIGLILTVAVFRLPEEFVANMKRDRPLDLAAAGWVFRLLALAATAQALYVGLSLLRPEKLRAERRADPTPSTVSVERSVRVIARTAAITAGLTLVYGLGAFVLTGERASVWLFLLIFAAQMAWNYRQTGQAAQLFMAETDSAAVDPGGRSEPAG